MSMNFEITLTFDRRHFEEIYFGNHQGSYIKNPRLKSLFRNLMIAIIVTAIALLTNAFSKKIVQPTPLILLSISIVAGQLATIILFLVYLVQVKVIYQWKKRIKNYLDAQEKTKEQKLILNENYFSIVQDGKVILENWSEFKTVEINENFISLIGQNTFLIPAKSLNSKDYNRLRDILQKLLK